MPPLRERNPPAAVDLHFFRQNYFTPTFARGVRMPGRVLELFNGMNDPQQLVRFQHALLHDRMRR